MARRRKLNYEEGTCFALPLRDGGWARGVVSRTSKRGPTYGYFFGPRLSALDDAKVDGLEPTRAVLVGKFGDPGLLEGMWPILGSVPEWNRDQWPMPPLIRVDEIEQRAWLAWYDDKTFECLRDEEVDPALASRFPKDGLMGYVAAEIVVNKLLKQREDRSHHTPGKGT
jgi:hypothetical protein